MREDNLKLDAGSEIYNKERYDGITKQTFKSMFKKDKWIFFKEYYLKFVLIGIAFIYQLNVTD